MRPPSYSKACLNENLPNTNRSQFFITLEPCPQYHKQFVGFANVIDGLQHLRAVLKTMKKEPERVNELRIASCGEFAYSGTVRRRDVGR